MKNSNDNANANDNDNDKRLLKKAYLRIISLAIIMHIYGNYYAIVFQIMTVICQSLTEGFRQIESFQLDQTDKLACLVAMFHLWDYSSGHFP